MKQITTFQLFVITGLIILLGVTFTAWRWYTLFDAFRAMSTEINTGMETPKKRSIPILVGLTAPTGLTSELGNLVSNPFPFPPTSPDLVPIDKIKKAVTALPGGSIDPKIEMELLRQLTTGLASLPVFDPKKDDYDFQRGSLNYRETRETARYWYIIGRLQAASGKGRQALNSMLGVALLARLIDPGHPCESALISRMIRCACQGIAAAGLVEIAPGLNLSHAELSAAISQLERIEEGLSIGDIFEAERRNIIELAKFTLRKSAEGIPVFRRQEPLARLFADEAQLTPYFTLLFTPVLEAVRLPFKEAYPKLKEHNKVLEDFQAGLTSPNRVAGFLFNPQKLFMEAVFTISVPNLTQAYANDVKSRESLRGAAVALAVHAYHDQLGRWPTSLAEVESWLGRTFPRDLFSEEPLQFKIGEPPRIFSVGRDLLPNTDDDMIFVPLAGTRSPSSLPAEAPQK